MNNTQIQAPLNDTNENSVDTKAKPHNKVLKKKKKNQNQKIHQRKQHNYHISGQKEYTAWSSCGTASPTVFENAKTGKPYKRGKYS